MFDQLIYRRVGKSLLMMIFMVLISGLSCDKVPVLDCFNSTGKIIKVEREIEHFHSIELMDNVNLRLRQSNQNKLVLEAGNNLMAKIYTDVNDEGILEIKNENRCNWVRSYDKPINVYLDFIRLDTLFYRSIGDVTNEDTIRMDTLAIDVYEGAGKIALTVNTYKINTYLRYGTADIVTSGRSTLSFAFSAGFGKIDNRLLLAQQVYLNNKSSNDIYIYASERISATIENIGNIYYLGNPQTISLNKSGNGDLIKIMD